MRQESLNAVLELARRDKRVVFVGSDLGPTTLAEMRREMPDRFFMEGVSEQAIIGMAAGLAMEGYIPYVNTIATFLTRRCYEQLATDLCLHKLKVRLIANGGGVVYAPLGPTHLAIEDMGILRALPNMTVTAPADAPEMRRLIPATLDWPGPVYIRMGKGGDPVVSAPEHGFEIGRGIVHRVPGRVLLAATGITTKRALDAADLLAAQGIACGVVHFHTLKPFDETLLCTLAEMVELVVTVEEHVPVGGLGSAVTDVLAARALERRWPPVLRLSLPDLYPDDYGSQDWLLERCGLHPAGIAASVTAAVAKLG